MESASCKWNPHFVFTCGFHLHFADSTYILRNPLTVAESSTTSYNKPQQGKCADKIYVTDICMRNPLKFVSGVHLYFGTYLKTCLWNPGTYRHKKISRNIFSPLFCLSVLLLLTLRAQIFTRKIAMIFSLFFSG